ncbi:hypothetical protein BUALT_Bualt03G0049200 [Buddleja alternifolia]|uniref:TCP domain-containing protein n=1 Tax=Buddleja alternifolia TaxID=168488 RepID=A0AAV6XVI7_9LAMI|nr:hypothetical protein BUALT_Bualt03G0049200 [Buddleja alternifolia]
MDPPSNIQLQAPNNEEDQPEVAENLNGNSVDAHQAKWREFVACASISTPSSSRRKFDLESKSKRRKAEIIQVHGGRIIRSSGRKDKHSKVSTVRGPRDRRLRLSPKTAIEFYDVQDRLGYDRASKAIDWLMKEAKSAIDALDEPPPLSSNKHCVTDNHSPPIGRTQENDNSIPGFGFFTNVAASSSSPEFQPYPDNEFNSTNRRNGAPEDSLLHHSYQEGYLSALTTTTMTPQIIDTSLEIARLQRVFTYANSSSGNSRGGEAGDYYSFINSLPPHFPGAPPVLGYSQMFTRREPLQSSSNYYSPISTTQFPGNGISNAEFTTFSAAATLKDEEKDKIQGIYNNYSNCSSSHFVEYRVLAISGGNAEAWGTLYDLAQERQN